MGIDKQDPPSKQLQNEAERRSLDARTLRERVSARRFYESLKDVGGEYNGVLEVRDGYLVVSAEDPRGPDIIPCCEPEQSRVMEGDTSVVTLRYTPESLRKGAKVITDMFPDVSIAFEESDSPSRIIYKASFEKPPR